MRVVRVGVMVGVLAVALGCGAEEASVGPGSPAAGEAVEGVTAAASIAAFQSLSVGGNQACTITFDQRGYCWGGSYGKLPVPVGGDLRFLQLRAGFEYTCGISTDNRGWCWGVNYDGQLGIGSTAQFVPQPTQIAGGRRYKLLRVGSGHACAITMADVTWCWGSNTYGQVGDGSTTGRRAPVRVGGGVTFKAISIGNFHTCGVAVGNKAYCWGFNQYGQIGIGNSFNQSLPRAVSGGLAFKTVAAGGSHSCGVTTSDDAYCWGNNSKGQLGDNSTRRHGKPEPVLGGLKFRGVGAGLAHSCGVTISRQAWCWGYNWDGGLGDGTWAHGGEPFVQFRLLPVQVALHELSWDAVLPSSAGNSTCGIIVEGRVYCWGSNTFGNLGDGTDQDRNTPGHVVAP
jgi:alpha-tubulin suppressor-like RCC1 family protein